MVLPNYIGRGYISVTLEKLNHYSQQYRAFNTLSTEQSTHKIKSAYRDINLSEHHIKLPHLFVSIKYSYISPFDY